MLHHRKPRVKLLRFRALLIGLSALAWLAAWVPMAAYFWPEATWIRLDLASRGIFLVRVVDKMDVVSEAEKYNLASHLRVRSLVFSGGQLVGFTMCPLGWHPYFTPATGRIDWESHADHEASTRMEGFALKYWKERNRESAASAGTATLVISSVWLGLAAFRFWKARRGQLNQGCCRLEG